jgi:hypothetical protein
MPAGKAAMPGSRANAGLVAAGIVPEWGIAIVLITT